MAETTTKSSSKAEQAKAAQEGLDKAKAELAELDEEVQGAQREAEAQARRAGEGDPGEDHAPREASPRLDRRQRRVEVDRCTGGLHVGDHRCVVAYAGTGIGVLTAGLLASSSGSMSGGRWLAGHGAREYEHAQTPDCSLQTPRQNVITVMFSSRKARLMAYGQAVRNGSPRPRRSASSRRNLCGGVATIRTLTVTPVVTADRRARLRRMG